jgi:hypothetical protein
METFVIRIWAPADEEERARATQVKGRLEHVTSGRRVLFHAIEELGPLIVDELRKADEDSGWAGDKED